MENIKSIWYKIDGYKTVGAMITILVLRGIRLFWPDLIGNELYQWIQDILLVIGGIGAGDKIRKRLTFKNNK